MPYIYSDPRREPDPHALPDVELFYSDGAGFLGEEYPEAGWYWQACFPGCMPDGEPNGPFETHDAAQKDIRDQYDYEEGEA